MNFNELLFKKNTSFQKYVIMEFKGYLKALHLRNLLCRFKSIYAQNTITF